MKKPVVVIVGRPNVGKSTLFNRLTGHREAIVDDESGVTRDRNYGEVEWNAKSFILIDTGGYVPESDDVFEKAIREQVKLGIDEADSIVFLVDAKSGINPFDRQIAEMVRNSGKRNYLVVNKIDSDHQELMVNEFYELGLGDPISISAAVGRRTGDFLDHITADFIEAVEEEDKRLKIAIVGRPNAGKSSLSNALLGFERSVVTDIPGTTRDSLDSVLKYYGEEIVLIDTAGLRKRTKVKESIEFFASVRTLKAVQQSDIAVIMIDAQVGLEKQDQKIIDEAVSRKKGIIIAVNKWDLVEKDTMTSTLYERAIREKLGRNNHFPIIFISALTKQRIFKLIELAKEVEAARKVKIPTSELNDKILPEIEKTPPPSTHTGREIKIKYITQGGEHYPVFIFFSNYPEQIPESYKRFLENAIRRIYNYEGVVLTLVFKAK